MQQRKADPDLEYNMEIRAHMDIVLNQRGDRD